MSLRISKVEFSNFRNYESLEIRDIGALTVFVGRNAIGKTNVLEGIQLLTAGASFRHPHIWQLVRDGEELSRIQLDCTDGNRQLSVTLTMEKGKKTYTVNGKRKPLSDIRGTLPAVSFAPDDLELAKGSSGVKRRAIDDLGLQLSRNYHVIARDYEKTVRYKNRLLKEEAPKPLIDAINETLVTCGAQLLCYRHALYRKMVPQVSRQYYEISREEEPFSSSYRVSWDRMEGGDAVRRDGGEDDVYENRDEVRELLTRALERHYERERASRRSLVGPHADEITFYISGKDASFFASQGQQRSVVLAWKLAEVEMVRKTLGTEPVLLLDDVMSELDASRRDMLVSCVTAQTQTFITSTDLSPFDEDLLSHARVIDLERKRESGAFGR